MKLFKPYELPLYFNGKLSEVMEFRTKKERADFIASHQLPKGYSFKSIIHAQPVGQWVGSLKTPHDLPIRQVMGSPVSYDAYYHQHR